jgi:hypothetical protein
MPSSLLREQILHRCLAPTTAFLDAHSIEEPRRNCMSRKRKWICELDACKEPPSKRQRWMQIVASPRVTSCGRCSLIMVLMAKKRDYYWHSNTLPSSARDLIDLQGVIE